MSPSLSPPQLTREDVTNQGRSPESPAARVQVQAIVHRGAEPRLDQDALLEDDIVILEPEHSATLISATPEHVNKVLASCTEPLFKRIDALTKENAKLRKDLGISDQARADAERKLADALTSLETYRDSDTRVALNLNDIEQTFLDTLQVVRDRVLPRRERSLSITIEDVKPPSPTVPPGLENPRHKNQLSPSGRQNGAENSAKPRK